MKLPLLILGFAVTALVGCVTSAPQWNPINESAEAEYEPYLKGGSATLTGQAFLTQRGGGVVTAAGRTVTLDPATSVGTEWWTKAGTTAYYTEVPPSSNFLKARRTTVADADGRFKFSKLAPGKYYVLTGITWEVPGQIMSIQGGLVGKMVEVREGEENEIIVNQFAQ